MKYNQSLPSSPFCYLILAIALLAGISPATAQNAPAGGNKKPPARSLRFVCTAVAPSTPETLWAINAATPQQDPHQVVLSTRRPDSLMKLPAAGSKLVIGEKTNVPEKPIKPLATITVPPKMSRGIALLIPKPPTSNGKGAGYHVHLIDEADVNNGDVYLLNLTRKPFQVRIDGKKINLATGKNHVVRGGKLAGPKNLPVQIFCKFSINHTKEEKWRLITASTWRLRPMRKEFCIFYWDVARQRPAIKSLTAFPPIKKPR
ncbi:MAG: hypothetical protein ACPG32_13230 [Akkermansiaceae bacterium]